MRLPSFALHRPSIRGRARADAGPLLLIAGVVAVVSLLAGAVPPLIRNTDDEATRDTIRRAGYEAAVQVQARWEDDYGPNGGRVRAPDLADDVDNFRQRAGEALDPALGSALAPPVTEVSSISLVLTDGSVQRHFQLEYVRSGADGPAVTWIAGGPPRPAVPAAKSRIEIPLNGPPWPMQVGVSEAEAAALKVRPGDRLPLKDEQRNPYNVKVSGIFRPVDPADPAWALTPWLLKPVGGLDGLGSTRLGGLLGPDSLPDARLAFMDDQLTRSVFFSADPDKLTWASAQRLATTVAGLKATSASSGARDASLKWQTQLDSVLRDLRDQVTTATAEASVLLITVLAAAVLVLLLTADLLARRRATALVAARQRGGSLPDLAAELLLESIAVTLPAAALGLAVAVLLTGGASIGWAAPVIVGALLAGPAFGTVAAARGTRDRRTPANRSARRWAQRTGQLRRATLELAVLLVAIGAVVALRQRGVGASGDAALPLSAPTLGVIAGTLVLVRLMPVGTAFVLRRALRSRRPLAVFGAAQAASTSARVLPFLVLTTTTALAAFAFTLTTTTQQGLTEGAWQTVGADARLDIPSGSTEATAGMARQIAAAPGVDQVVTAQMSDGARMIADNSAFQPRLIVVDPGAFQRLLADTPLADAPQLSRLTAAPSGPIPALVRTSDGGLASGTRLRLLRDGEKPVEFTTVGEAPTVGNAPDVVVVPATTTLPPALNTIWATGPGAAHAATTATGADAEVVLRADILRERRTAPLTTGLVRLQWAAAATLLALGMLGFALGAAASAPARWETLARLRTLGLRPRDAQRVAAAELLPPVLVGAVCGPLLGLLLFALTVDPLSLRLLTAQTANPLPMVPWWQLLLAPVALLATLAAVVATETRLRRPQRLGDVLRAGQN
jgi:putative ABC transport system permease protein